MLGIPYWSFCNRFNPLGVFRGNTILNNYHRGRGREGDLKMKLWEEGFVCLRSYRSAGGAPLKFQVSPDLIREKKIKAVMPIDLVASHPNAGTYYIQVSKYLSDISQREFDELKRLAKIAGVKPIFAYQKESRRKEHKVANGWKFCNITSGATIEDTLCYEVRLWEKN